MGQSSEVVKAAERGSRIESSWLLVVMVVYVRVACCVIACGDKVVENRVSWSGRDGCYDCQVRYKYLET